MVAAAARLVPEKLAEEALQAGGAAGELQEGRVEEPLQPGEAGGAAGDGQSPADACFCPKCVVRTVKKAFHTAALTIDTGSTSDVHVLNENRPWKSPPPSPIAIKM